MGGGSQNGQNARSSGNSTVCVWEIGISFVGPWSLSSSLRVKRREGKGQGGLSLGILGPMFPGPAHTQHVSPLPAQACDRQHGQDDQDAGLPAAGGEALGAPSPPPWTTPPSCLVSAFCRIEGAALRRAGGWQGRSWLLEPPPWVERKLVADLPGGRARRGEGSGGDLE